MSDTQISRLLLENPGDVAELVPYLIGFTPEESLVIVAIADKQVQVTARADLTDMQQQDAVENLLDRIWAQFPSADAFLIAYTQDVEAGWAILERCADHLASSALQLTMLVNQDTWHLPDGSQGLVEQAGRVSVAAASQGYQRLARRADLEARFVSAPDSPALDAAIRAVDPAGAEPARPRPRNRLDHQGHRPQAPGVVERSPQPHPQPVRRGARGDRRNRSLDQRRWRQRQHRPHPRTI